MGAAIDRLVDVNPEFLRLRFGRISELKIRRFIPPKTKILHYWVGMQRQIARGEWDLTLREKRLISLGLSKLDYTESQLSQKWRGEELDFGTVIITPDEYADFSGCSRHDAYRDWRALAAVADSFSKKIIRIVECPKSGRYSNVPFVSYVRFWPNEGLVEIKFNPDFLPFFTLLEDIEDGFVSYKLGDAIGLGISAWRLFELLRSYSPGTVKVSISGLKMAMARSEQQTGHFLDKTLKTAITDLQKVLGWDIYYDLVRSGRKIKAIIIYRNPTPSKG